jgi:hypothetical protein
MAAEYAILAEEAAHLMEAGKQKARQEGAMVPIPPSKVHPNDLTSSHYTPLLTSSTTCQYLGPHAEDQDFGAHFRSKL